MSDGMDRLRYRAIEAGYGAGRIVAGYEVRLPCGARSIGETLDEALRSAEHARDTHRCRVERLEAEARERWQQWHHEHPDHEDEIPF